MASSSPAMTKNLHQTTQRNYRQRVSLQRIQNVLLIWLDTSANDDTEDCRNTMGQLRRVVNNVNIFTDGDECLRFIKTITNNKICMVISGSLGQHIVPRVHDTCQVDAIFIFCSNKKQHEQWAHDWPKIRGVFTKITPICEALREVALQCEHNATPMSFVTSKATTDRLDPCFMYTQIFKEILLTIDFNDQHIHEYTDFCQEAFRDNPEELKHIKQLERYYHERTPIWWYTRETFLYPMLNRALRTMDGDVMMRMGFFISDLHRHIEREHRKQFAGQTSATFTVYRGQGLSTGDFEQLTKTKGGLMSFNCFLSTSKERSVSLNFAQKEVKKHDTVGILFKMKIDLSQSTTPFASIREFSDIKREEEVLFAMHSVFRIHEIKAMTAGSRLYEVHLSLSSDNDSQLQALTNSIRAESFLSTDGWYRLALVLIAMGQLEQAEQICENLLEGKTSSTAEPSLYNQAGLIKNKQEKHQEAILYHAKALAIQRQSLPPTHPDLAASYNNIGLVYKSMGDYPKALLSYEKALVIQKQSLPSTHPDLAASYNNIGLVYKGMGNYSSALASYEKALAIYQASLPPTHANIATSHNNIGLVCKGMGNFSKALTSLEKALAIKQQSLPPAHPTLATSYNNIGSVYYSMRDHSKALTSFEKALTIQQQSLPPTHSNLATSHNNIGSVYSIIGDYPKALASLDKALAIFKQSLPSTHPSLAASYNNIGSVYRGMGDYPKALVSFEKAVSIYQKALPATHPLLTTAYKNIGLLYKQMGNFSKAHFFLGRAVRINSQD